MIQNGAEKNKQVAAFSWILVCSKVEEECQIPVSFISIDYQGLQYISRLWSDCCILPLASAGTDT